MSRRRDISSNTELVDTIVEILEERKADIQQRMADEGENASGMTSASLRVELDSPHIRLIMGGVSAPTAPPTTLEVGVPPGVWAPASRLFQWSIDKGIDFKSDRERWSFAYAMKWTIHKYGTERYLEHKDIYTTPVNKVVKEVSSVVGAAVQRRLWQDIMIALNGED